MPRRSRVIQGRGVKKGLFSFFYPGCLGLWLFAALFVGAGCQPAEPLPPVEARTATIGLLCRKQFHPDPYAPRIYRHIDTLLADGSIVTFHRLYPAKGVGFWNLFFPVEGKIARYDWLWKERRHYVDIEEAKKYVRNGKHVPAVTDWYRFNVTPQQAEALRRAWEKVEARSPTFRLFGRNCATFAGECLMEAGILRPGRFQRGVPGIDRPENLLRQLQKQYGTENITVVRGYFGYDKEGRPVIEPLPPKPPLP